MDPISVAASILGLLGAAAKVSEVLRDFVKGVKDAPRLAHRVSTEVEDLTLSFRRLQSFITSERLGRRSRAALITIDQLLIVLTHCVMTFSELETVLDGLKTRNSIFISPRLKWVAKEQTISRLLQRLQSSKAPLNLVLTTLSCTRLQEAQDAIDSLTSIVNEVMASNHDIARRLEDMDLPTILKHRSAPSALEGTSCTDDDVSTGGPVRNTQASGDTTLVGDDAPCGFAFEQDLRTSRVYTRVSRTLNRRSDLGPFSLPSSTACSMGTSFLSGLSLADVSNVSLLSLPVAVQALSNGCRYREQQLASQLQSYFPKDSQRLWPRSSGKILLLVLKQLQIMQGLKLSRAELEEARNAISVELLKVFRQVLLDRPADDMELYSQYLHVLTSLDTISRETLLALQQLWENPEVRSAIEQRAWPLVPDNMAYIMDNLLRIFRHNNPKFYDASLSAHIKTNGVYKSTVSIDPFDFEVFDVSGTRAGRKKWVHCLEGVEYVIFVADLNGYCQRLAEDPDANQMLDALEVFEKTVAQPVTAEVPVFLFLNKADLFEKTIASKPISDYFADYAGGANYYQASQYFAERFACLDKRSPGKLHCYMTDSLDTASFQKAWRQVQEKMLYTTLKF
ncbi:MAG: hypothetical protein Q9181_007262 [Wetmoreana brouardii]